MSPLGIQRLVALIIFVSPWIFVPNVFKDVVFMVCGILLFISTLDLRKRQKTTEGRHDINNTQTLQ